MYVYARVSVVSDADANNLRTQRRVLADCGRSSKTSAVGLLEPARCAADGCTFEWRAYESGRQFHGRCDGACSDPNADHRGIAHCNPQSERSSDADCCAFGGHSQTFPRDAPGPASHTSGD